MDKTDVIATIAATLFAAQLTNGENFSEASLVADSVAKARELLKEAQKTSITK
jgi:hypothetical protein